MKGEEIAKEYAQDMAMYYESAHGSIPSQFEKYLRKAVEHGYNEGFKDCAKSRLNVTTISDYPIKDEWHDLEKDPTDLPKDKHNVWCKWVDQYGEGWYDKDTGFWTLIYRNYYTHCIKAWCELPTFDKE